MLELSDTGFKAAIIKKKCFKEHLQTHLTNEIRENLGKEMEFQHKKIAIKNN